MHSTFKNAIFLKSTIKIASASGDPPPNPRKLPAAGGSAPQTLASLLPTTITILSCSFLAYNALYYLNKKKQNKITPVHVLLLLIPCFCRHFCALYNWEIRKIFL